MKRKRTDEPRTPRKMSRDQLLQKLGNAVRAYRGVFNTATGKWLRPPNPGVARRMVGYIEALGLDPEKAVDAIERFANFEEMREWFKEIETPKEKSV